MVIAECGGQFLFDSFTFFVFPFHILCNFTQILIFIYHMVLLLLFLSVCAFMCVCRGTCVRVCVRVSCPDNIPF